MDIPSLPYQTEAFDAAYSSYVGYMIVEMLHSNAILRAFVHILEGFPKNAQTDEKIRKKKTARNRWFLAYTLIKNEELIALRWHRRKLRWKQEEIERKKAEARAEKLKRNSLVKNVKRTLSSFIKEIILSENLTDKFTGIYVGTLVDTLTDISRHFIENEPKMTTSERLYLLWL